mmetsp:Transcript_33038/g.85103  ORF Transcript_33038/g.85103 Transcript_33038/m.85103 type:complete len:95 (-) Transcript_33038:69-353(-)
MRTLSLACFTPITPSLSHPTHTYPLYAHEYESSARPIVFSFFFSFFHTFICFAFFFIFFYPAFVMLWLFTFSLPIPPLPLSFFHHFAVCMCTCC